MITQMFRKQKELHFERTYPASIDAVWAAWTEAERLRHWWGADKTTVADCEVDARPGGAIRIVMVAGEAMGKYAGTRWPMEGTFTIVEPTTRLVYEARSWTEGEEEGTTIVHTNELVLTPTDGGTTMRFDVTITDIGPKAKMAAFGMKWGYKQQFGRLDELLRG